MRSDGPKWKLLRRALLPVLAVAALAALAIAGAAAGNSTLNIPLSNDTAAQETDCPADTTSAYWHFVISPNNGSSAFITFHLNLGDASTYDTSVFVPNGSQLDNVFVAVPSGKTLTSLHKTGSSADVSWNGSGNAPTKFQLSHTCGKTALDLTVSKDATPSFTRAFGWKLDKSANTDTVYSAGGGQSGAVRFTIDVTKDSGTDKDWAVKGTITVQNPNPAGDDVALDSVSDAVDNGGTCTVDTSGGLTVPGGGPKSYPYSCSYGSAPSPAAGTNTVTIKWSDQTLASGAHLAANSATATKSFDFAGTTPTVVGDAIDVTDTNGGSWHFSASGSVSYDETYTDPAGTCTPHTNTATITQTGASDSVTVKDCQGADLTVSKTATPSFTRTYKWAIGKSVDQTYVENNSGSATFNYNVAVSHDAGTDSGWQVSGKITVTNPNDWEAVKADVTDAIDNGGACTVAGGAAASIPAASSVQLDYTCTYAATPSPAAFKNTATAAWDATAASTLHGSASGDASGAFAGPTTVTDECVSVSDPADPSSPHVYCVGDAGDPSFAFTYAKTVTAARGTCTAFDNTATFTTNDTGTTGSSSRSVKYCNFNPPLTIGYWKNHIRVCGAKEKTGTGGCNNNGPFAVSFLPQSLGTYTVDTGDKALAVFNANNCSSTTAQDAVGCLAAQLLAAKLNRANGSNLCIATTISAADAFLVSIKYVGPTGTYALSAAQRATAVSLKSALDTYNNGGGC